MAGFVYLVLRTRGNTFVFDEWSWIEFRAHGASAVFDSYNDHLLVVPLAVYQLLFRLVGLGDYAVYRVLAVIAHLACVLAVFGFARRRVGGVAALLVIVPLAFFGTGWEYEVEGVNFGFTLSLAMGIAALVALDARPAPGRDAMACALLTVGLAFSEFTLIFAVGIALAQLLEDRAFRRAWIWLVPIVVYGIWYLAFYTGIPTNSSAGRVPKYAADMVASAAGGLFGQGLQKGRLIVLAVAAFIGWRLFRRGAVSPRLLGLLATALIFWLSVSIERNRLNQPWAPHYVYTGAFLIVLIVLETWRGTRPGGPAVALGVALAALAVIGNVHSFAGGEGYVRTSSRHTRAELAALRLLGPNAPSDLIIDPHYAPQLIAGPYRLAAAQFGPAPTDTPAQLLAEAEPIRAAADDVLLRGDALQITPTARAPSATGAAPAADGLAGVTVSREAACLRVTPRGHTGTITIALNDSGALLIDARRGTIQIHARRFASDYEAAPLPIPAAQVAVRDAAADRVATVPWRLMITTSAPLKICTGT